MATRTETRFGKDASVGTAYVIIGSAMGATANLLVNICNLTAVESKLRMYIADNSWTTGEPAGGTLIVPIAYDLPIAGGDTVQISGIILDAGDKLVVRASQAASLAVSAHGVEIT